MKQKELKYGIVGETIENILDKNNQIIGQRKEYTFKPNDDTKLLIEKYANELAISKKHLIEKNKNNLSENYANDQKEQPKRNSKGILGEIATFSVLQYLELIPSSIEFNFNIENKIPNPKTEGEDYKEDLYYYGYDLGVKTGTIYKNNQIQYPMAHYFDKAQIICMDNKKEDLVVIKGIATKKILEEIKFNECESCYKDNHIEAHKNDRAKKDILNKQLNSLEEINKKNLELYKIVK